jgi:hypothetical protein
MHIRTAILIAALAVFSLCAPRSTSAQPQPGSFGFGLILGEPTGLTLKGSIGSGNAWDAAIGSSWFGRTRIHGDYLWAANVFNSRKAGMYFGLGAAIGFGRGGGVLYKGKGGEWYYYADDNAVAVGVRGSLGLNFMPFSAPVEIFGELAPIFGITPVTGLGWDAAIGIRYYP